MLDVKTGDLVFHYNSPKQSILAVSRVKAASEDVPSKEDRWNLPSTYWERPRRWVFETNYSLLDQPIGKKEIPEEWRLAEGGPFDTNGDLKFAYLNPLSKEFAQKLIAMFSERLPADLIEDASAESVVPPALVPVLERIKGILAKRKNVILYGPPGTGKTFAALHISKEWQQKWGDDSVWPVTFHPSYGYEDFVQGFRPTGSDDQDEEIEGSDTFRLTDGILMEAAKAAALNPDKQFLLFIDEINRGDVARIFGELITYIESTKRGELFVLSQQPTKRRSIPANLFFLGTMNTADKSVSLLDVALRRRFAFIHFRPDPTVFGSAGSVRLVDGLGLADLLRGLNSRLRDTGIESDRAIGHALLLIPADAPDSRAELRERFALDIAPLVAEYSYLDRQRTARVLPGLVDDDGTFLEDLSDAAFVAALKEIAHSSAESTEQGATPLTDVPVSDLVDDTSESPTE